MQKRKGLMTFEDWELAEREQEAPEMMTYAEYKRRKLKGKAAKVLDAGLRKIGSAAMSTAKQGLGSLKEEAAREGRKKKGNWADDVLKRM